MSVDALSWAFRLALPPTEKLVLLSLADRADAEGIAFPSAKDTLERTGLKDRSIRQAIGALVDRGLIGIAARFDDRNGRQRSNSYTLLVGECGDTTLRPPRRNVQGEGAPVVGGGRHVVQGGGGITCSPLTVTKNPHKEPSPLTDSLTLASEPPKPAMSDFEAFWKAYPRRTGKIAAEKAYQKARKRSPAAVILAALVAAQFPTDPQFVPHPATWLNQGRWMDETPAVTTPKNGNGLFLDDPAGFDSSDAYGANAWGYKLSGTKTETFHGQPVLALCGYPIIELAREICEAAGWDQDQRLDLEPIAQAIRSGYDPDMMVDVVKSARRPDRPTLNYYAAIWRDRHAKASAA